MQIAIGRKTSVLDYLSSLFAPKRLGDWILDGDEGRVGHGPRGEGGMAHLAPWIRH